MTHAKNAADKIHTNLFGYTYTAIGGEETAELIQAHAIKPAVDEATSELKDELRNLVEFIKGDVCCLDDDCPRGVRTKRAITAAEKLLEK